MAQFSIAIYIDVKLPYPIPLSIRAFGEL